MKVLAVVLAVAAAGGAFALSRSVRADEPNVAFVQDVRRAPLPDSRIGTKQLVWNPTLAWVATQLVPSPELAWGRHRHIDATGKVEEQTAPAFGLRWQVTPLLWSFGVHRSQSRWRYLVVDPIARQSGSLELSASLEHLFGHVDRFIARPGLRVYLPVAQRGEYVSVSLGTSVYGYEGFRVAYDVGAYLFGGLVGLQVTVAPTHAPLAAITTLRLRYF